LTSERPEVIMTSKSKRRGRYPLHIQIATLFIILITLVGVILGWYNFRKNKQLLLSTSQELIDWITREVRADFRGTYAPVVSTVDLISVAGIMQVGTLEERLKALPVFREALNRQPELSAIYIGYGTGDFFILRPLKSPLMREFYDSPEGAMFVAIESGFDSTGTRSGLRIYLDGELRELERRNEGESEFDPRERPWYKRAMESSQFVTSAPYLYYTIQKVGVTVARRSPDKASVVAADITLQRRWQVSMT